MLALPMASKEKRDSFSTRSHGGTIVGFIVKKVVRSEVIEFCLSLEGQVSRSAYIHE